MLALIRTSETERDQHDDVPASDGRERYRGLPMTLANMRQSGVRSLSVTYEL
jgi:hypothetical protein